MIFPREKMIQKGASELKNDELLAIILGTGNKKENVFSLSKRLIQAYRNPSFLTIRSVEQIEKIWNVGKVHACKILATIELGKRLFKKSNRKPIFQNPKQVARYLGNMKNGDKEQLRVLYLSTQNSLLNDEIIAIGSLDQTIVHPREVFQPAFIHGAAGIIVAHNHPSGDPFPSKEDMEMTEELRKTGKILKIPILDHIIIGEKHFFSFEEGEKKRL